MTVKIFNDIKKELEISLTENNHPFRLATLATVDLDKAPTLRTIVIRKISKDLKFTFFTDKRSQKVIHIIKNNKVSMLFYHPEKRIQLKIEGVASITKDTKVLEKQWSILNEKSKKDYTTEKAPGSGITDDGAIEYLNETHNFCMITIEPRKIEYLKLNTDKHTRIRYSLDKGIWEGEFLVP